MIDFIETQSLAGGCAITATAGIASHLLYFIRGDHNRYAHRWIMRALLGIALLAVALFHFTSYKALQAALLTGLFASSYFIGLYTSISIYRVFLHPLRRLPGPFWARLSNLYHAYIIRKSDNYLVIQKLHEKYGPIVRTGAFLVEGE